MKPPPRVRTKRNKGVCSEPAPRKKRPRLSSRKWTKLELNRLLNGLKKISYTGQNRDIDYDFLGKRIDTRSISEISVKVDSLRNKLISNVSFQLQKIRREEKKSSKPIDEWTHMASTLAGTLEVFISAAFSQMLIVSSIEPCTLRNCDPFPVPRPPTKNNPTVQTVPLRRMPRVPVQGVPATVSGPVFPKTPAPTLGPARSLVTPYQVVRVPNKTCFSSQSASSSLPSVGLSSATAQIKPGCSSSQAAVAESGGRLKSSIVPFSPQRSLRPSPIPITPKQSFSILSRCSSTPRTVLPLTTTGALHPGFGQSNKHTTEDRTFKDKCVVDFEKIYNFLGAVQNLNEDCHLTPMESAIVLDLLMSLPEELRLLDCNNLHNHVIQMYQSISAPANSHMAKTLLVKVEYEPGSQSVDSPHGHHSDPAGTADWSHASGRGEKRGKLNESGGPNMLECFLPLNPFMVPLKLLQRKQTSFP